MNFNHEPQQHRFIGNVDGQTVTAHLQYSVQGEVWNFFHVYVPPEMRGMGVAGALAKFAFEEARKQGVKVLPTCPYLSGTFVPRHPEYKDVLAG